MPRPPALTLSRPVRESLVNLWRTTSDAEVARRSLALAELASGRSRRRVAERLHTSRQNLDNWIERFEADPDLPLEDRLRDRPRSGAPNAKRQAALELIGRVIERPASDWGWPSANWTARLLARQLAREKPRLGPVGEGTVRLALREAGYVWKRPRYVLARRDPHWRESKGGSSGAWPTVGAPFC